MSTDPLTSLRLAAEAQKKWRATPLMGEHAHPWKEFASAARNADLAWAVGVCEAAVKVVAACSDGDPEAERPESWTDHMRELRAALAAEGKVDHA